MKIYADEKDPLASPMVEVHGKKLHDNHNGEHLYKLSREQGGYEVFQCDDNGIEKEGITPTLSDFETALRYCAAVAKGDAQWPTTQDEADAAEDGGWND